MNNNKTQSFTEDLELKLYSYYKHFRLHGSTYMYYTINDSIKGRLRFSTDEDWIKMYLEDALIENDPIKEFVIRRKIVSFHGKTLFPIMHKTERCKQEIHLGYIMG
jgi:hypothetical protein